MSGIKQPTEEYFKGGQWGFDGTQWRKLNLLFGFRDGYRERKRENGVDVGNQTLQTTACPAGKIRVITSICVFNSVSACTKFLCYSSDGTIAVYVGSVVAPVAMSMFEFRGWIPLIEGEFIVARLDACTAGDNIFLDVHGFDMDAE